MAWIGSCEGRVGRQRHTPEQIIGTWREAEVALAKGHTVVQVCRSLGLTEQTTSRWRQEDGGLQGDHAKRLKALERENARLTRAVADLTLDKLILKEAAEGHCSAQLGAVGAWHRSARRWACRSGGPVGCWASPARPNGITNRSLMMRRCSLQTSSDWPANTGAMGLAG